MSNAKTAPVEVSSMQVCPDPIVLGPAQIAAAVAGRVAAYVAARGVNESGELPAGWAASIASDLDLPCDERLVQCADEAYAAAASR